MLTAKEIVTEIANDKEYYALCKKLSPNIYDDLFQDLLVILLEYDPTKLIDLHTNKRIRFFVVKILMNQACSPRSDFYKRYRNPHNELSYDRESTYNGETGSASKDDPLGKIRYIIDTSDEFITEEFIAATYSSIEKYSSMDENNWYRAELFKQYLKEGNIRALNKKTKIPVMSIQRSLQEFKRDIKHMVNENTFNPSI